MIEFLDLLGEMTNMIEDLNRKISKVKENLKRRQELEKILKQSDDELQKQLIRRRELSNILNKKEKEIHRLESAGINRLFYSIFKRKNYNLNKERQEYDVIKSKYDDCINSINKFQRQIVLYKEEISNYYLLDSDYDTLMKEKEDLILNRGDEAACKLVNYLDYIIDRFQENKIGIEFFRTKNIEDLDTMFSKLNPKEYEKILIAGGDGTINQVVNLMMKYDIDLPIGIFPIGTANDYARCFNLPNTIEEMLQINLQNNYTYSDIGYMNDKCFVNVASLGFLIDISQKTDRNLKNSLGTFAYYLKGIEELSKYNPINIKINSNELNYEGEILFMLIMNGRSAGGFTKVAPQASVNDGLLEVFIFKNCPIYELTPLFFRVMNGDHINSSNVICFRTDSLIVDCDEKIGTDIDGEEGSNFPLNIRVSPKRLQIITKINDEKEIIHEKTFSLYDVKNAFTQVSDNFINEIQKPFMEFKNERNTLKDVTEIIKDLPRHNTFSYINKGSLSDEYFNLASSTLDNGYLYIVLSSTGSPAGETIKKITGKQYSHASLSFDEELKTIISYNGGENLYSPGLNQEMIEYFNQKPDANIVIYKIKVNMQKKKKVLEEVRKINEEGSSYNVLGLFLPYSYKENIMFCSQFVYTMLKVAGVEYFDKRPQKVKPTDFLELDSKGCLEYCSKVFLKDTL